MPIMSRVQLLSMLCLFEICGPSTAALRSCHCAHGTAPMALHSWLVHVLVLVPLSLVAVLQATLQAQRVAGRGATQHLEEELSKLQKTLSARATEVLHAQL